VEGCIPGDVDASHLGPYGGTFTAAGDCAGLPFGAGDGCFEPYLRIVVTDEWHLWSAHYPRLVCYGPQLGLPAQTMDVVVVGGALPYDAVVYVAPPSSYFTSSRGPPSVPAVETWGWDWASAF